MDIIKQFPISVHKSRTLDSIVFLKELLKYKEMPNSVILHLDLHTYSVCSVIPAQ